MAKKIVNNSGVNKNAEAAIKDAVKAHFDIPQGTSLAGTVTFVVGFDYKRGEDYTKQVPQKACPTTLLALALQRMGATRGTLLNIVKDVMEMTDEERKTLREEQTAQVTAIMEEIGLMTVTTVKGMQTFDSLSIEVK
jgi:hypothetical protein